MKERIQKQEGDLTRSQYDRLVVTFKDLENIRFMDRLSSWDQRFARDFMKRLDKFQILTKVSPEQWKVIRRIEQQMYTIG